MILLSEKFPWARLNFTLHQIQHAGQLICENGGCGLGVLSEEALEAIDKDRRNFMENFSKKSGASLQLQDTIGHSLERSDPRIYKEICRFRPITECSSYEASDHTVRSCSKNKDTVLDSYDSLVKSVLM